MSAPRQISPILDGFLLGENYSRRDGAQCCVATEQQSGDRFIVKVISVPASAVQMDALLLAGAFSDRASANAYFKEQARDILNEAKTLRHMATLGGFTDYDCVQVVPAEHGNGYDIYLLSPWRQELQMILQQDDLSQLDILNMGLDLCAALSSCRHAGYFYANLKPSNVFRIGQHYRIGDLGFMPMSSLNRVSVPEQYRSSYTPPELMDGSRALSDTADVYALGLILYQAYNGGALPGKDAVVGRLLAPPQYADYEMAEIILRACAPDPSIRWRSPEQMGHALTRYMQRNGMHDTPVIPPALRELAEHTKVEDFLPEEPVDLDIASTVWNVEDPTLSAPLVRPASSATEKAAPIRRRVRTSPSRRRRTGRIAIGVLALILVLELALGIWLFGRTDKTNVTDFRAQAGPDGNSVTLVLTHDGTAPETWTVTYSSKGEETRTATFSGESYVIFDLTAGAEYTFILSAPDGQHLAGQTRTVFTLPMTP